MKSIAISSVKLLFIVLLVSRLGLAWWENGHMLTAQIAKIELMQKNMTIYNRVEEIVQSLDALCDGRTPEMVQAAVWPDDIKATPGFNFLNNWHFYDRPVNPQGLFMTQDPVAAQQNSVDCMTRANKTLFNDDGSNSTEKAMMMRYLLHVVGDMHQPLHNANLYNLTLPPGGDIGGNVENVTAPDGTVVNLHGFFDSGALKFQMPSFNWIQRPFNQSTADVMDQWANDLMRQFPRSQFTQIMQTDVLPSDWTKEGVQLAQNIIYPYFQNTSSITLDFQNQMYNLCQQQVALGGYRLTDQILYIFSNYTKQPSQQQLLQKSHNAKNKAQKIVRSFLDNDNESNGGN